VPAAILKRIDPKRLSLSFAKRSPPFREVWLKPAGTAPTFLSTETRAGSHRGNTDEAPVPTSTAFGA